MQRLCCLYVGATAWTRLRVLLQDQLDTFVYKALGQTVTSIAKGAAMSHWFPEAPLSDSVSSYMQQLVTMLQVPLSLRISRMPPGRSGAVVKTVNTAVSVAVPVEFPWMSGHSGACEHAISVIFFAPEAVS